MWEISNSSQILNFVYSIALGMIFGILYDFLRAFRLIKNHSEIIVFTEDIIYFLLLSISTFVFLITATNGQIRAYILFGIIIGFLIYYFTLSRLIIKILFLLFKTLMIGFSVFLKGFYLIFNKIDTLFISFLKNTLKCFKKLLKMIVGLLYTYRKSG